MLRPLAWRGVDITAKLLAGGARPEVAIISGGAAGTICAHLLDREHAVTLLEREPVLGGHIRTLNGNASCDRLPSDVKLDAGVIEFSVERFPTFHRPLPGLGVFRVPTKFDFGLAGATQAGTAATLDTRDTRVSASSVFRNGHLWFAHHGGLPPPGFVTDRTAVFWYEVDPTLLQTQISRVIQSGVINGGAGVHHFYPSLAVNAVDNVCVGFSRSDSTKFVEAVATSRFGNDPAGTMMTPLTVLKTGEDSYVKTDANGFVRWGDYSATSIDPNDDLSFWTLQQYAVLDAGPNPGDDRWGTWWGSKVVTTSTTTPTTSTTTTSTTTTSTSTTTTSLPSADLCGPAPEPDGACELAAASGAGKSSIQIKDKSPDTKDQLKWKWNKGTAVITADFETPDTSTNTYRVCLYDAGGKLLEMNLPAGGTVATCDGKPCRKPTGTKGLKYKNKTGSGSGGITGAKFKEGAAGKSQVQIKAQGKGGFFSAPATPGLTEPVVIQLLIDDGGPIECFKTSFTTFTKKDAENYKAKGP